MTRRRAMGWVAGVAASGIWTAKGGQTARAADVAPAAKPKASREATAERIRWWQEARFGMFIHWGLYAHPGHGEWMMHQEHIPPAEYAQLTRQFNPRQYNPEDWVSVARDAGMKYLVLTTRHHDGFCLFDSKASDFTSTKTAAQRDLVAEYVAACHRARMPVGLYYSLIDWRFPGAMYRQGSEPTADFKAMVDQAHLQVRELMTNYGKIDILWYDGGWPGGIWRAEQLSAMVRKLQPGILINDRSGLPEDFATSEQNLQAHDRPWEACMTLNDTWGYNYADRNYKTPCQVLHMLLTCVARKGNLLLNVSPDGDGRIPAEQLDILRSVGRWMRVNHPVVYGGERAGFHAPGLGWTLHAKGKTYLVPHRWYGSTLMFGWCDKKVLRARLVATGAEARVEQKGDRVWLHDLPVHAPDPYASSIELTFDA